MSNRIWFVIFGTDEGGDNTTNMYGCADTGKEAAKKALETETAKELGKGIYISTLQEVGDLEF